MTTTEERGPAITVAGLAEGERLAVPGVAPAMVGVPVVVTGGGAELAGGLPARVSVGDQVVPVAFDAAWARRQGFAGKVGQSLVVSAGAPAPALVLLGMGDAGTVGPEAVRRAAAALVRAAGSGDTVALVLPAELVAAAGGSGAVGTDEAVAAGRVGRAAAEGAVLASYRFDAYRSEAPERRPASAVVLATAGDVPGEAVAAGVRVGSRVARAVWFARDLVNEPPSSLSPVRLAEAAVAELAGSPGVAVEVWDERRIAEERLGGLLGVARGSAEPPRLVWARYEPADPVEVDGSVPHVVLVGKGITFDSGGLSLKTAAGMTTMKTDMSGAAAVLGAVSACGDLGVGVRVTAIACVTENMPGGRATKPGDVLRARNGTTIEVLNTDAEGRLVLADGLSLAAELQPDMVVDLATLTGACVVALGSRIAGVFGNDDGVVARVRAAADRAGEATWPLPLPDEYRSHIDSEVADIKNVGKNGQAGAIAAAMFLARFAGSTPWAHLDIAGPARSDEDSGLYAKGGTGFGVRTLLALLESYRVPAESYAPTAG